MRRGHRLLHRAEIVALDGFDPSGVPCVDELAPLPAPADGQPRSHGLAGLAPAARAAAVMEVVPQELGDWLAWGCLDGRPVMFAVEPVAAAEMARAVALGEAPTAIVEPHQLLLEPLD